MLRGIKRERALLALCLAAIAGLAWWYLWEMAAAMDGMDMGAMNAAMESSASGMAAAGAWSVRDFLALFLMWAVMMAAMMLPSAAPMILVFQGFQRRRLAGPARVQTVGLFVAGYLAAWAAYSLLATLAQMALRNLEALSETMALTNPALGAAALIGAGLYQWSPLKHQCLSNCRSPLHFIMSRWRNGRLGAWKMGLEHGSYCVGCCWLLMALLFVVGVMNLAWVLALAVFVLLEKLIPGTAWPRIAGLLLVALGVWRLL